MKNLDLKFYVNMIFNLVHIEKIKIPMRNKNIYLVTDWKY